MAEYKSDLAKENDRLYKRKKSARKYRERLAKGLCGMCGKHPLVEGLSRCQACREAHRNEYDPLMSRVYGKAARERKRERGECLHCSNSVLGTPYTSCAQCLQDNRERNRRRRELKRSVK